MSMIAVQTVIAGLCVDAKFREAFLGDPDKSLESFDLLAQERHAIKTLDMNAVQEYADSLLAKRIEAIRKWFPLSFLVLENELLPERLNELLYQYGLENVPDSDELGGDWVRVESERFYNYLRHRVSLDQVTTAYFADVLTFEMLKLTLLNDVDASRNALAFDEARRAEAQTLTDALEKCLRPLLGRHARFYPFRYDMAALVRQIENRHAPIQAEIEPTWVLFFKKPQAPEVTTSTINRPLKDFLELCDGTRTVDWVTSFIAPQYATSGAITAAEARAACLTLLDQLYRQGAIMFIERPSFYSATKTRRRQE